MKNKIILIMSLGILAGSTFFGCAESGDDIKETGTTVAQIETETEEVVEEYRMRDIEKQLTRIAEKIENDLTEDEIKDHEIHGAAWAKECQKEGLPVDKKIRIRGTVKDISKGINKNTIGIFLEGSGEYEYLDGNLYCEFKKNKYPLVIFAEKSKNIVIEGIFAKNEKTFGLSNCKVISPEISENYYLNNISDTIEKALEKYDEEEIYYKLDADIYGQINNIISLEWEEKDEIKKIFRNEENVSIYIDMFDYLLEVGNEEESDRIFIFCDKEDIENLKIKDKIYVNTTLYRSSFVENETRYISLYCDLHRAPIYIYD